MDSSTIESVLDSLRLATQTAPDWGKAWHHWALFNVHAVEHYAHTDKEKAEMHVASAVQGFFRSVALGQAQGESPACQREQGSCDDGAPVQSSTDQLASVGDRNGH